MEIIIRIKVCPTSQFNHSYVIMNENIQLHDSSYSLSQNYDLQANEEVHDKKVEITDFFRQYGYENLKTFDENTELFSDDKYSKSDILTGTSNNSQILKTYSRTEEVSQINKVNTINNYFKKNKIVEKRIFKKLLCEKQNLYGCSTKSNNTRELLLIKKELKKRKHAPDARCNKNKTQVASESQNIENDGTECWDNTNALSSSQRLKLGDDKIKNDSSLRYNGPNIPDGQKIRALLINKLENLLKQIIQSLVQNEPLEYKLANSRNINNLCFEEDRLRMMNEHVKVYSFVKENVSRSRSKFNLMTFLLGKIYHLLKNNSSCTRREIYYELINYVPDQISVDNAVNYISYLLNVPPWHLGIIPTSKGLIYGDLKIFVSEEKFTICNNSGGTLVPNNINNILRIESKAHFILVIEKDTVFQKLLDEGIPNSLSIPFIMITGKGFPDLNTRLFLRMLWIQMSIPIFVLVDADPDGIEIMLTYRFGSTAMAHISDELAVPGLRWLGVHPSEIMSMNITKKPLTTRDRKKINDILKRPYIDSHPKIRKELEVLLNKEYKAEIEGIIKADDYLTKCYLPNKFFAQDYI